jgi:sugar phosphate isomerase/epimerase
LVQFIGEGAMIQCGRCEILVACKTSAPGERQTHCPMKIKLLFIPLLSVAAFAADSAKVNFKDHIGMQMWSLRTTSQENTGAALDLVKGYGITEVETAGLGTLTLDQYVAGLKSRGLVAIGMHTSYDSLKTDLPGVIATAKALGVKYVVCPWVKNGKEPFTEDSAHAVAVDFNKAGAALREAGFQLGWHPHGYEFIPSAAGHGETLFDIVARETDPKNLVFEMDVFWVFHAGQDPVQLLEKYGSRWQLMHVKDIRKGAVTHLSTGSAPPTDNVPVGQGQIDWSAVLRKAQDVGTQHFLIEDETPAPLQCIPASLKYLRGLSL